MKGKLSLTLLALLLIIAFPAAAKGPFSRVIITGDTLEQAVVVTDPLALNFLSLGILEDFQARGTVEPPADAAEIGYDLERQWEQSDGVLQTIDRVRYHPNVNSAERGYIFMAGTEIGISSYDGKWFPATSEGETALRAVLAGEPVTCPVTPSDDSTGQPLIGEAPIWLTPPLAKTDAVSTASERAPNAFGSVLLDSLMTGSFSLNSVWLQGSANAPIRFTGTSAWRELVIADPIVPQTGDFIRYDWEAIFAEPGCYALNVWAGSQGFTAYVEVQEGG